MSWVLTCDSIFFSFFYLTFAVNSFLPTLKATHIIVIFIRYAIVDIVKKFIDYAAFFDFFGSFFKNSRTCRDFATPLYTDNFSIWFYIITNKCTIKLSFGRIKNCFCFFFTIFFKSQVKNFIKQFFSAVNAILFF